MALKWAMTLLLLAFVMSAGCGPRVDVAPMERALEALHALQGADGQRLADLAHPTKGVRFSPYAAVRTDGDRVFRSDQLRTLSTDQTVYHWGTQDGNGRPIDLTLSEYLQRFVRLKELPTVEVGYNQLLKTGNTRSNITEVYPQGVFVEFHYPGTGEHADYTWSSVRLVLEQVRGTWYLVGVINDQWTI